MTTRTPARIALIDSGVNARHPHIRDNGWVALGPALQPDGSWQTLDAQTDAIGHGTAVCAALLDLAPGSEILSIQLFRERPVCAFEELMAALEHALDAEPGWINLSLGTTDRKRRAPLEEFVRRATARSVEIVAPATAGGLPSYPGCLDGVTGVIMDASLPRNAPELRESGSSQLWYASPYPRDLPDLPRTSNLAGPSMAAANLIGWLVRDERAVT